MGVTEMKLSKWLKPTSHKVIFSLIIVAIAIGGGFGIKAMVESMKQPEITFKEPITLEYGQHSDADSEGENRALLDIFTIDSMVDKDASKFDTFSVYEEALKEENYQLVPMKIDTSKVGDFEGVLYAKLGKNIAPFPFKYSVKDTQKPELSNIENLEIEQGGNLKHDFKAIDVVDGELEVVIEGDYDTNKPGEYSLVATAIDTNDNKTSQEFKLTVKEKKKEVDTSKGTITNGSPGKKVVALTFDDGPHPTNTPRLLNILEEKGVKATFFILGERADEYPNIVKQTHAKGHEVENHSYSHPDLAGASLAVLDREVERTNKIIDSLTGRRPLYFRPPYGSYNKQVSSNITNQIALWSVDTLDWKSRNAAAVQQSAMSQVHNGSVILMHDIHSTTVDAVGPLIDSLKAQGYTFVRLDELR